MYYHGTKKNVASAILLTHKMQLSEGDDHWLGDGVYFYVDVEYAFRWILMRYTKNFTNLFSENYSKIFEDYSILSVELDMKEDRWFSMEDINHKMIFLETKSALCDKAKESKKYGDYIKENTIVDGVVFNYLFKYQGYDKKYDAVKAVFPIACVFDNSRIEYLPEPQICVKNIDIISNYQEYSEKVDLEECKKFIEKYNRVKNSLKIKRLSKYKNKKSCIKYKKEE